MNKNSSYQSGVFYEVGDTVRLKKDYKIYVFECIKQGIANGSLTFSEDFYKEVCDGTTKWILTDIWNSTDISRTTIDKKIYFR